MAFHERNKHQGNYDIDALCKSNSELSKYIRSAKSVGGNDKTIDFMNKDAVKALNQSILFKDYGLKFWEIPDGNLTPPVPSRADYVHHLADLLALSNRGKIPKGNKVSCLDIGVGSNLIYPIIGANTYNWSFVGSDVHDKSLASAQKIIDNNPALKKNVQLRKQNNPQNIFKDVILDTDYFDLTMCNPPFHASEADALKGSNRKIKNLKGKKSSDLNFGGTSNELWYEGGEISFIERMIKESKFHKNNVMWFTTLVSKQTSLKPISVLFKNHGVAESETLIMDHGNKKSRFIVWTFMDSDKREKRSRIKWK